MISGNHSKVVRNENGRRVTFIQSRMVRGGQRSSGQKINTSGEYMPHYYLERENPRPPARVVRVVRRRNDVYNEPDMYKVVRSKRYDSYDPDSETDYSSEYSSGESDTEIYVYPKKRNLVRVVPVDRNSIRYISRSRTNSSMDNDYENTGKRYLVERKHPNTINGEYRTISRMEQYSESDSEYTFSSDEDDVDTRVIRVMPIKDSVPARKVPYYRDSSKASQGYTLGRPKSNFNDKETIIIPEPKRFVAKSSSDIPKGAQPHLMKDRSKNSLNNTRKLVKSHEIPIPSYRVVNKPEITRQNTLGRDTGPQNFYGSIIRTSQSTETLENSSSTSSHTSSDSSETDTNSSYSSVSEQDKNSPTDQTSRLILDYSKILKSREEQKLYEKARKNYEHEKHIVSLVQKEINPPRRTATKSDKSPEKSEKPVADEKQPKPLPGTDNVIRRLEEAEEIKENIEIEKLRKKQSDKRGPIEVWDEIEDKNRDRRKINKNDPKQPFSQSLIKRKKRSPVHNKYEIADNVEVHVNYNENFEDIYPEPRQKGCEQVYFIDLTKPAANVEPKPFDEQKRRIVPQPKKTHNGPLVKVGGGWNTLNDYMERHVPVRKFEYQRQLPSKSQMPDLKRKYYGFHSNYKVARSNTAYRPLQTQRH